MKHKTPLIARFRGLAKSRPGLAFLIAVGFYLATPWNPAPWDVGLGAQTFTHNTTTLTANVATTDTTVTVASASAATGSSFGSIAVGQMLLVDQEIMTITGVSSTTLTVQRRVRPAAHTSGTTVYIGAAGSFQQADPPAGRCTTASNPAFWINLSTGGMFTCGPGSTWARSIAPWNLPFSTGNGATVTLTTAQSGGTFLFDRAAGIVYTLPAPFPGLTFDFIQTVTITSNSAEIATATVATQFIQGLVHVGIAGGATGSDWACNGTSHVAIKQNGTTSGGILGGRLHFVAVSTTIWQVDGLTIGSGTEVTPCSTTV